MNKVFFGDCRESMCEMIGLGIKAQTCVTSPPYLGLRDYGHPGQLGLESTVEEYVANLVTVFRLVREVLADDGVLWLNLGDSYSNGGRKTRDPGQSKLHPAFTGEDNAVTTWRPDDGARPKNLLGIPWRVALALQADGWYLRQDIIWAKPNPMPESVTDRCTKSHEYLFMLTKNARYYFDADAIKEQSVTDDQRRPYGSPGAKMLDPRGKQGEGKLRGKGGKNALRGQGHFRKDENGPANREGRDMQDVGAGETRNRRSVWTISTKPYKGAHFATFPPELVEPCVLAGSRPGDIVFDPFMGSGTTAMVAARHGRRWLGCELNEEYGPLQEERLLKA